MNKSILLSMALFFSASANAEEPIGACFNMELGSCIEYYSDIPAAYDIFKNGCDEPGEVWISSCSGAPFCEVDYGIAKILRYNYSETANERQICNILSGRHLN